MNSKQKGKRGELEAAEMLRSVGFINARRTAQYCGSTGQADDVVGVEGLHIEVKRCERLEITKWIQQAERDTTDTNITPVVLHRRSREPWYVTLPAIDFFQMYRTLLEND